MRSLFFKPVTQNTVMFCDSVYLNLYLILELEGTVLQMSRQRNAGLHHHPQSCAAFTPAKHTHGEVVLSAELYRRLQDRSHTHTLLHLNRNTPKIALFLFIFNVLLVLSID